MQPENTTSTCLRKHIATMSQILNLDATDLESMANFLGHDISVHRSFYCLPQGTVQIVQMGRLLTAFDQGTIAQYSGKSLDDISIEGILRKNLCLFINISIKLDRNISVCSWEMLQDIF